MWYAVIWVGLGFVGSLIAIFGPVGDGLPLKKKDIVFLPVMAIVGGPGWFIYVAIPSFLEWYED